MKKEELTKKNSKTIKISAGLLAILMIVNITLYAMMRIDVFYFWFITIVVAVLAYFVIPQINKR